MESGIPITVTVIQGGARLVRLAALACAAACTGCAVFADSTPARLDAELQALVASALAEDAAAPGIILRVEAGGTRYTWTGAAGTADRASGAPLRPDHSVRIASNTKTYVAAAVLRLVETQRLDLDDPIDRHLGADTVARLASAGYDAAGITVRSLLQHTSGLRDYFTDDYLAQLAARPARRWTRHEQLALALAGGGPLARPGERFHYSDTGYLLLGETLEGITRQALPGAVRDLLGLRQLGLASTWFESLEAAPRGAERAHQYLGNQDANDIDASADLYGGGGLVANAQDLGRFYRALVRGEVLRPATTALMLAPSPQSLMEGAGYGMGIAAHRIDDLECLGHSGFWGTVAWHCPRVDVTVVAIVTGTDARRLLPRITREAVLRTVAMQAAIADAGSPEKELR